MKDIEPKIKRAQALLGLVEKYARKLPDDMSQEERNAEAMSKLDRLLGPEWRKEVERADIELPEAEGGGDVAAKRDKTECMYKKIRSLLEREGQHADNLTSRVNGEDEDEESSIRILLIGR